jgi:hypothetical protein
MPHAKAIPIVIGMQKSHQANTIEKEILKNAHRTTKDNENDSNK